MANPQRSFEWVTLHSPSRETESPGRDMYHADAKRKKEKADVGQRDFIVNDSKHGFHASGNLQNEENVEKAEGERQYQKQSYKGTEKQTEKVGGNSQTGKDAIFLIPEVRADECRSQGFLSSLPQNAETVVITTLEGYARVPKLLPVLSFPDLDFFASHAISVSVVLVLLFLFYTRWRTPRSKICPSSFVIPSSSVFQNPGRYTRLRKISVPVFARDYVAGKIEFRDTDNPASAMKRLNEWAYFPGGGWFAFLGLVPLWYTNGYLDPEKEFAVIANGNLSEEGCVDKEALEVDSELFHNFGRMRVLFPLGQDVDKMLTLPQLIAYQLDAICDAWLRLRPDDRLLDLSSGCSGLSFHAAEKYGCSVTSVFSSIGGAREATAAAQCSPASKFITAVHGDSFFANTREPIDGTQKYRRNSISNRTFTKATIINPPITTSLSQLLRSAHSQLVPRGELLLCLPLLPDTDTPSWPVTEAEHLLAFAKLHGLAVGPTQDGWKTLAETTRELLTCGFELQWASTAGKDMGRLSSRASREIIAAPWYPSRSRSGEERRRKRGLGKNGNWNAVAHRKGVRRRAWELYLAWAAGAYTRGVIEMYWIYSVKKD